MFGCCCQLMASSLTKKASKIPSRNSCSKLIFYLRTTLKKRIMFIHLERAVFLDHFCVMNGDAVINAYFSRVHLRLIPWALSLADWLFKKIIKSQA